MRSVGLEVKKMSDEGKPQNNYDRLLKHLKDGSLAALLVQAHRDSDA
jgi:hypothetical protein